LFGIGRHGIKRNGTRLTGRHRTPLGLTALPHSGWIWSRGTGKGEWKGRDEKGTEEERRQGERKGEEGRGMKCSGDLGEGYSEEEWRFRSAIAKGRYSQSAV